MFWLCLLFWCLFWWWLVCVCCFGGGWCGVCCFGGGWCGVCCLGVCFVLPFLLVFSSSFLPLPPLSSFSPLSPPAPPPPPPLLHSPSFSLCPLFFASPGKAPPSLCTAMLLPFSSSLSLCVFLFSFFLPSPSSQLYHYFTRVWHPTIVSISRPIWYTYTSSDTVRENDTCSPLRLLLLFSFPRWYCQGGAPLGLRLLLLLPFEESTLKLPCYHGERRKNRKKTGASRLDLLCSGNVLPVRVDRPGSRE